MATSALNQLTGMPNLPLTRSLQQPAKTPKGYLGSAEVGPVLSELGEAETKAQMKVGEADIGIEEAKRKEKGTEAEQKMLLTERMGREAKDLPERKALGEARQELKEMAFVPSKETAQDLAAMFSLISVVGMVAGKGNAQLAMSAMNGMLEGHQKGRADLYKQQQTEFDKNFKAMQAKISTLEKGVTEAMELKKYDKEAGEQKMIMELAKAESPLLKAMKDKQGDVAVLNNVRSIRKDMDTLFKLNNDLQAKADARQDKKEAAAAANERARLARVAADERARLAREQQLALAQAKGGGALKKGEFQANFISEIVGRRVDVDAASKMAATADYKDKIRDLQDKNQKIGGAPGLKIDAANYINKFLATKAGPDQTFSKEDLDRAYAALKEEKSFKSLSDKSKTMAKAELDAVMAYLQTKYGNRAPVAEFRAAQTVLNRGNMTSTAYNEVMNAQIKDANARLIALGFRPNEILNVDKHFAANRDQLDLLTQADTGEDEADISPYEFETEAEAEEFLRSVGLPEVRARVGGQIGTVTLPTR